MDIITDNSKRGWVKVANSHRVPDYVNKYVALTKEAAAELPSELYADEAKREYPIDSAPAVWLAAAYFKEASASYRNQEIKEHIKERIKEAATIFGISSDVEEVFSNSSVKVATAADKDENYCWVDQAGRRMYPVFDKEGAEKAIQCFEERRFNYPLDMRVKLARNIISKACDYDVEPSYVLMKEAGFGVPNRANLMSELLERARITKDPEIAYKYAQINETIATASTEDLLANLEKLAEVIDMLDEANGLKSQYNVKLLSPNESIYTMTLKEASAVVDDAIVLDKYTMKISSMAKLDPDTFNVLGDDFANELSTDGKLDVQKMATILPTLPAPDKKLLEEEIKARFYVNS